MYVTHVRATPMSLLFTQELHTHTQMYVTHVYFTHIRVIHVHATHVHVTHVHSHSCSHMHVKICTSLMFTHGCHTRDEYVHVTHVHIIHEHTNVHHSCSHMDVTKQIRIFMLFMFTHVPHSSYSYSCSHMYSTHVHT